jgi:hypothetical protein
MTKYINLRFTALLTEEMMMMRPDETIAIITACAKQQQWPLPETRNKKRMPGV